MPRSSRSMGFRWTVPTSRRHCIGVDPWSARGNGAHREDSCPSGLRSGSRHFRRLLCILLGGILLGGMFLHTHSTSASPVSSPTPVPTLMPDQQRAQQAVRAFYPAYDRRDLPAIFALLPKTFRYVDCDYAHHRMHFIESKPALRRWLAARFQEHDRFGPVRTLIADQGPGKVGVVGPVSRFSASIDPLVSRGLLPSNDGLGKLIVRSNGLFDLVLLTDWDWCAAGTLPRDSMPKKERALGRAFVDAYNRHDVTGVLALVAGSIVYDDCDFSQGTVVNLTGKAGVAAWLRARFAQADRLVRPRIVLRSWLSEGSNPTTIVIEAGRADAALGAATQPLMVTIIPDSQVRRISMLQVSSPCSAQPSS